MTFVWIDTWINGQIDEWTNVYVHVNVYVFEYICNTCVLHMYMYMV